MMNRAGVRRVGDCPDRYTYIYTLGILFRCASITAFPAVARVENVRVRVRERKNEVDRAHRWCAFSLSLLSTPLLFRVRLSPMCAHICVRAYLYTSFILSFRHRASSLAQPIRRYYALLSIRMRKFLRRRFPWVCMCIYERECTYITPRWRLTIFNIPRRRRCFCLSIYSLSFAQPASVINDSRPGYNEVFPRAGLFYVHAQAVNLRGIFSAPPAELLRKWKCVRATVFAGLVVVVVVVVGGRGGGGYTVVPLPVETGIVEISKTWNTLNNSRGGAELRYFPCI